MAVITVEQLFRNLSYGELSNLAAAVDGNGAIKKEKQNQVIHFINEGLTKLHTRFPLSQTELFYTTTGAEMIEDLPDDLLQIISIFTSMGESLTFGTQAVPMTLYVHNSQLHIPPWTAGSDLQVTLQLRHPTLVPISAPADLIQEVTLIPELHEALTAHVAYKMYREIRTAEGQASAADHMNKYNQVCAEAIANGILPSEALPVQKFEERGWV